MRTTMLAVAISLRRPSPTSSSCAKALVPAASSRFVRPTPRSSSSATRPIRKTYTVRAEAEKEMAVVCK